MLLFFNDDQSFGDLVNMMQSTSDREDLGSLLNYHIALVHLLAYCADGTNVTTDLLCHSLLSIEDIVHVVTHVDCLPEV